MKKGQAAMEFLMTYGWAILVVIAAIAALAYFGVLDPARLLPERCQFPAGMDCIDKPSVDAIGDTVTLALRNNIGFKVEAIDLSESSGACTTFQLDIDDGNGMGAFPKNISNNGVFRVELGGCGLTTGDKFDADVTVTYVNEESGLTNKAIGSVRGRAGG